MIVPQRAFSLVTIIGAAGAATINVSFFLAKCNRVNICFKIQSGVDGLPRAENGGGIFGAKDFRVPQASQWAWAIGHFLLDRFFQMMDISDKVDKKTDDWLVEDIFSADSGLRRPPRAPKQPVGSSCASS
jgi:hypothetical protein